MSQFQIMFANSATQHKKDRIAALITGICGTNLQLLKWFLVVSCLAVCNWCSGQFQYKAVLPVIDSTAFYKIGLPPAVMARSLTNLSDMRILDAAGKETPYIVPRGSKKKPGNADLLKLPSPSFSLIDSSDKKSYVSVQFNDSYLLDQVRLNVSGPKYYKRNLVFYPGNNTAAMPLWDTLAANKPTIFSLGYKAQHLLLAIENEDNPPLHINAIEAYQTKRYLVSYLLKGQPYNLVFGNEKATAPVYDLSFFADSVPGTLAVIEPSKVVSNQKVVAAKTASKESGKIVLWLVMVAVLLLLLFASNKLIARLKENT